MELIGKRVVAWRHRRGLTQTELAGLAGITQSYLSRIETGDRILDRRATQAAIAGALTISVAQLLGEPDGADDPIRARATAHVPAIRAALVEMSAGERRAPVLDLDTLAARVAALTELRNAADYAGVAGMLPPLLLDLHAHGTRAAPSMVEALFAARYALKTMGYADLGLTAAQLGVTAASEHGDPAWIGQATYSLAQAFPVESAALAAATVTRAADTLRAVTGRGAREVYGCLHILAGYQNAIAGRAGDAVTHLDEAHAVAVALGEPPRYGDLSAGFNGNWFGVPQVQVWRVAVAAELGDTGTAIDVAARVDLAALPCPNRWVYLWIDLARALATGGLDQEAMVALAKAERAAPQHFHFNPIARELVASIIARAHRRAVSRDMASLAAKLGIAVI